MSICSYKLRYYVGWNKFSRVVSLFGKSGKNLHLGKITRYTVWHENHWKFHFVLRHFRKQQYQKFELVSEYLLHVVRKVGWILCCCEPVASGYSSK